jgi:signal transduction histidine kinase
MAMRRRAALPGHDLQGPAIGLLIGIPLTVLGLLVPGQRAIPTTIAFLDTAAITCLVLTAVVASQDALLRADRRSLPMVAIGLATAIMWTTHLLLFPGDVPGLPPVISNHAVSLVFLAINLALPSMLAMALTRGRGTLDQPARTVVVWVAAGVGGGLAITGLAVLAANWVTTVNTAGVFARSDGWIGLAGLIPVSVGLFVFVSGRRGDERVSGGVAAALVFAGCNSIVLFFLTERYTAAWYADHVLAFLAAAALMTGQIEVFVGAVRRELRAAASVRASLDIAESMARQIDLSALIERLMVGAMRAVGADRATLMGIEGEELRIEASIDRTGASAPLGMLLPTSSLRVDGVAIVPEALRTGRPIATGAYDPSLLAPEHARGVGGVQHYITWPLVLAGEVDAILFLARRRDIAFGTDDEELLSEFATIAALLLRNARLLRAAEVASVAKSNFLNLAAHELRTPVSVIRGYLDMLVAGDLGPLVDDQRAVLQVLERKAEELAGQVEQLLVASQATAAVPLRREAEQDLNLKAACAEAVERAAPRVALVDARIELAGPDDLWVRASATAVDVVLDNLINNALTYSRRPAAVEITVDNADGPSVRVRDHGIGISAEQRDRVFDQFHRVDRPDFGFPSGTGLGLYISRELAQANHGSLELEWSEVDTGSCFRLRLAAGLPRPDVPRRDREPHRRTGLKTSRSA